MCYIPHLAIDLKNRYRVFVMLSIDFSSFDNMTLIQNPLSTLAKVNFSIHVYTTLRHVYINM